MNICIIWEYEIYERQNNYRNYRISSKNYPSESSCFEQSAIIASTPSGGRRDVIYFRKQWRGPEKNVLFWCRYIELSNITSSFYEIYFLHLTYVLSSYVMLPFSASTLCRFHLILEDTRVIYPPKYVGRVIDNGLDKSWTLYSFDLKTLLRKRYDEWL